MTRNDLLELATAIYFLPNTIDNNTQRIIANSIASDLKLAGVFNKDNMTPQQFVSCATVVEEFNKEVKTV